MPSGRVIAQRFCGSVSEKRRRCRCTPGGAVNVTPSAALRKTWRVPSASYSVIVPPLPFGTPSGSDSRVGPEMPSEKFWPTCW